MPRYQEEQPTTSRRRPDKEEANTSRGRGSGRRQQQEQPKTVYHRLFALFANEHNGGRLQVDVRAFNGDEGSIEDILTLEEFLFFCEKLYYGEVKLTGSMWECDEKFASHSGNVRLSDDQLEELKAEFAEVNGEKPSKKASKGKAETSSKKQRYAVPEDDEDEEEEFEVVEIKTAKAKAKTTVRPALVMPVEELSFTEEEEETEIPY